MLKPDWLAEIIKEDLNKTLRYGNKTMVTPSQFELKFSFFSADIAYRILSLLEGYNYKE